MSHFGKAWRTFAHLVGGESWDARYVPEARGCFLVPATISGQKGQETLANPFFQVFLTLSTQSFPRTSRLRVGFDMSRTPR